MAIRIETDNSRKNLFCESKWWGDPDMPQDMEYPMIEVTEEGETYMYPLTFICQINCEDIAEADPEGLLPHEGMLYFFAAVDEYSGYDSPVHNGLGEWPKEMIKVKYTRSVNLETFQSHILLDDEDEPLSMPAVGISFSRCGDTEDCTRLLGLPFFSDLRDSCPDNISLLQIDSEDGFGLRFYDCGMLNFIIRRQDLEKMNVKRARGYMSSL